MLPFDIDESEDRFKPENLTEPDSEDNFLLWMKQQTIHDRLAEYNRPCTDQAVKAMNYVRGAIFTADQLTQYRNDSKVPIQPRELKKTLSYLVGTVIQNKRNGYIMSEDPTPPQNAASPEDMNVVLQWMRNQLKSLQLEEDALRDGLIVPYPICIEFDISPSVEKGVPGELIATRHPWDAFLPGEFQNVDLSDVEVIEFISIKTKAQILEWYPDRKEYIEKQQEMADDPGRYEQIIGHDNPYNRKTMATYFNEMVAGYKDTKLNGKYTVIRRLFRVKKPHKKYVDPRTGDVQVLPRDWDEQRVNDWLNKNRQYDEIINDSGRVLWQTVTTTGGLVLDNQSHWYQENGDFPAVFFLADIVNRMPSSPVEDWMPYVFSIAASETEGLDQVRKGTGDITFFNEGALASPETFGQQVTAEHGVVPLKEGRQYGKDIQFVQKKPNETYINYADRMRMQLNNVHGVNEAMQGANQPRQSGKAKEREILQSLAGQTPYIRNYINFGISTNNKILSMIPYCMNEFRLIEVMDEWGKQEQMEVNKPVEMGIEFDESGAPFYAAKTIANDLSSVKWRYVLTPGDDSPVSRMTEVNQFSEILEAIGNTIFRADPAIGARVLMALPNRLAREAGKEILQRTEQMAQSAQQSQAEEKKIEAQADLANAEADRLRTVWPKLVVNVSPRDMQESPLGFQMLMRYLETLNLMQDARDQKDTSNGMAQMPMPSPVPGMPAPQPQPVGAQ